jgi:hypothetical protein
MMPRSQIAALAVLLVGLAIVLVLVADTGVSTGVYLADHPTETVTPTIAPSPTPLPEASAANWASSAPGQLTYMADPNISAQIGYQTTASLDEVVSLLGLEPPAADDQYPLLSLLNQIHDQFQSQAADSQLTLTPDAFTGPAIEVIEGVPVASIRLRISPQTTGAGQEFGGLDLVEMLFEHTDGSITFLQYALRGEPNPVVYADFRAWLQANITQIASTSGATPPPQGTPATAAPETSTTQTATPEGAAVTPETTQGPTTEATQQAPGETVVTPETTEEATQQTTEEIVVTPEPTAEGTQTGAEPAAPEEKWTELAPGQVMYTLNPSAFIQYSAAPVDEFAQSVGMELAAGAPLPTAEEMLNTVRARLETQIEENAIMVEEGAFQGPTTEDVDGIPFTYLHLTLQAQTSPDGQPRAAQDILMGLIETGENRVTAVEFVYQGDPDSTIYADFREWLAQNITRLSELEVTVEPTPAPTAAPVPEPTATSSGE